MVRIQVGLRVAVGTGEEGGGRRSSGGEWMVGWINLVLTSPEVVVWH